MTIQNGFWKFSMGIFIVCCLFLTSCRTFVADIPNREKALYLANKAESYEENQTFITMSKDLLELATIEERFNIMTIDAFEKNEKVTWISGRNSIVAIPQKEETDKVTFVYILYVYMYAPAPPTLPRQTIYSEIRLLNQEGEQLMMWKQPLCINDNNGKTKDFFNGGSCSQRMGIFQRGGIFEDSRVYYQKNNDKIKFSPLLR